MLKKLVAESLQARKDRSEDAGTLNTVLAEAKMRAKNDGNREPTDEDVIKTVQIFLKNLVGNRELLIKANMPTDQVDREIHTLEAYLPQMMSAEETRSAVKLALENTGAASIKDMGRVISNLKQEFGTGIDMKLASNLIKSSFE